jgi:hypothetical protein
MKRTVAALMALVFVAAFGVGVIAPVLPAHACSCPTWCPFNCPPSNCVCSGPCHCCQCAVDS